jgi:hypothetical protein
MKTSTAKARRSQRAYSSSDQECPLHGFDVALAQISDRTKFVERDDEDLSIH